MSRKPIILIVDDNASHRGLLESYLQGDGFDTRSAECGEEALVAIAANPPDVVLLDTVMPGLSGYQVASALKANPSTAVIPIILVTAQVGHRSRLDRLQLAADEFLTRPIDRAELCLRVRAVLRLRLLENFYDHHQSLVEQQVSERTAELRQFRHAMDATTDAILLVNRSTMRYLDMNATACELLGYQRDVLLAMEPAQIFAASAESLAARYDNVIAGEAGKRIFECRLRSSNGAKIPVELHRQAVRSGADWIIVDVARPVAEQKQTQRKLARYDALTGLPNRNMLHRTLTRTLAHASEHRSQVVVMLQSLHIQRSNLPDPARDVRYAVMATQYVHSIEPGRHLPHLAADGNGGRKVQIVAGAHQFKQVSLIRSRPHG